MLVACQNTRLYAHEPGQSFSLGQDEGERCRGVP